MKKISLILIIGCITATVSCKKELGANTNQSQSINTASQENATATGTLWGEFPTNSDASKCISEVKALGVHYVRTEVILKGFTGSAPRLDQYLNNGYKVLLNLIWNRGTYVPFPTDMTAYRSALAKVLAKYGSKIELAVIENEPTTDLFHSGPIENYITELKNAVSVCKNYGVKVADGAIHIENVLAVKNGNIYANKNTPEVAKLIKAYKDIDLDYVNLHTAGTGTSYPLSHFTDCADYIRFQTGHPVMSNEWHTENNSFSLMQDMVNGWKAGNYKYALPISSKYPLYKNGSLTTIGKNYKNAIN
jgi:hypothetical protein